MTIRSVVLINESRAALTPGRLGEVARALQTQTVRDFEPVWGESARVTAVADAAAAPDGSWPIRIVDEAAELGVHLAGPGQPYAVVQATDDWTIAASHELLEMLADPEGNRVREGYDILPDHRERQVQYLVEVCDPCQVYDYTVHGIAVSDFVRPEFYEQASARQDRFDFLGRLDGPLEVPKGCHLSWWDPRERRWYQKQADGVRYVRDARSAGAGNLRDDRDRSIAAMAGADRHDLLAARRAMYRDLAEAALDHLFSDDERMRQIIDRTAAKHRWDDAERRQAVQEYRRHLLLRYLHPGLRVAGLNKRGDELWHEHILDTDKYRADCERIFGGPVDHQPFYTPSDVPPQADPHLQEASRLYYHEFESAPPELLRTSY
jgi:hypothetical protein